MLRSLPQATIEQLAASLERATIAGGAAVFEEGEHGDRVYVVAGGCAEVLRGTTRVQTLGRGECFGEIALLRDCVRAATVRAATACPLELATLSREWFLTVVTG
jgi:CRP-like cAMP-binding protein